MKSNPNRRRIDVGRLIGEIGLEKRIYPDMTAEIIAWRRKFAITAIMGSIIRLLKDPVLDGIKAEDALKIIKRCGGDESA